MRLLSFFLANAALVVCAAAQPGQTVFTIVDSGLPSALVRSVDAWTLPPAATTPTRTILTLPDALQSTPPTAIATVGFPDVTNPDALVRALVVLGTATLDASSDAEVHVFSYSPNAPSLVPVTMNVKLPGAIDVKDLHRTDTGCVLALGQDASGGPRVFRISMTPNGTSVSSLVIPLTGIPSSVLDWTSIGSDPNGRILLGGATSVTQPFAGGVWSAPTQGGALSAAGGGPFLVNAVDATLDGNIHVGGAPNVTPTSQPNSSCGAATSTIGPPKTSSLLPLIQVYPIVHDIEIVAGALPGFATGLSFGRLLIAMNGGGIGPTSRVYFAPATGTLPPPPCPLATGTGSLSVLFSYPPGNAQNWYVVRKIALWDTMNTYGCECPVAASGGRPVIVGSDPNGPSATVSIGSTYSLSFFFDAPGTPSGATAATLQIGPNPIVLPQTVGIVGGGTKVADLLNDFYNTSAGGLIVAGFQIPANTALAVPNNPFLIGQALYFQWIGIAGGEITTSPGLHVMFTQ